MARGTDGVLTSFLHISRLKIQPQNRLGIHDGNPLVAAKIEEIKIFARDESRVSGRCGSQELVVLWVAADHWCACGFYDRRVGDDVLDG